MDNHPTNLCSHPSPKKVTGRWTRTEHDRFIKALEKFGRDWTSVQKFVKTRSLSQVRSHAQKFFMKMSSSDIDAMIAGSDESDFQSFYDQHETAYQKKNGGKKINVKTQKQLKSINRTAKPISWGQKQDLVQIFKRAIDLEILELNNQSHENSSINCNSNKSLLIPDHLSNQQSPFLKNENKFQSDPSEVQVQCQETKQMQFVLPDFTHLFEAAGTLAH